MKITRVYTKKGDDGMTSLVGGTRVTKTNARVEAYGTVDELSANLGNLASWMKDGDDKDLIVRIQRNLFTVCSNLATDQSVVPVGPSYTLNPDEVILLEDEIDAINASIPPQTAFILPGGSHEAAICHVCRTVCRRAERLVAGLANENGAYKNVCVLLNRLSDFFFILARFFHKKENISETVYKPTR